jgi:TetR/AcrR family transcriptional repressor of nem operon
LIRAVVEKWADEVARDADRRGCLVVNAAIELGARDSGVAHCVEMSWRIMETTLTSALLRAQHAGELPEHRDPRALSSFLVVMLQGMRVIARVAPDTDRLQGATAQALAALT